MSAVILHLPATGWCVRAGIRCAHYIYRARGRVSSACGCIERLEEYVPQRLRHRQREKPRCLVCEAQLTRRVSGESC